MDSIFDFIKFFIFLLIQTAILSLLPGLFINLGCKIAKIENVKYFKSYLISFLGTISFFIVYFIIFRLLNLIFMKVMNEAVNNSENFIFNLLNIFKGFADPAKFLMNMQAYIDYLKFFFNNPGFAIMFPLILIVVFWILISTSLHILWAKIIYKTGFLKSTIGTIYVPISWIIGSIIYYQIAILLIKRFLNL